MSKYHISPSTGEAKPCKASISCPFGDSMPHFNNKQEAQAHFEKIMSTKPIKSVAETKWLKVIENDNMDTVVAINESGRKIVINGKEWEYFDLSSYQEHSQGNSKAIADYISAFSQPMEDDEEEYFIPLSTTTYTPIGNEIQEHSANIFTVKNPDTGAREEYVVDFAYSEVNPNADYPYVDSLDNWKKDLDKISFMGVEDYIPPPPDPRAAELPKVKPDEYNPLLETAVLDKPMKKLNGSYVSFLKVDEVKVAVAHYRLEDDGPHLMTLETRPEYRQQGYMKKLLNELAKEHNVEKVHSSGSFTQQGFDYTKHLTNPNKEIVPSVNFPEYNDETPLKYVEDWIEGYTPN